MKRLILIPIALILLISSCDKGDDDISITKAEINGVVQKGPFLNGTSIEIYELDKDLSPTGKVYSSQILDNSGLFQLKNVALKSRFVQLKADGYYFNEITANNSNSPVMLFALTDITDKSVVNVNVLSHLAKGRIEYLMSSGSLTFIEAREQAEQEILKIFSFTKPDMVDFDLLDISVDGENNAILLAISLITQGFRTEADLSDLLANINTDIRQDGVLDSPTLGSQLLSDTRLLALSQIRKDLEERYLNFGQTVTIPNFEKYVKMFIDSSSYSITGSIEYPEYSNYGENILYGDKRTFSGELSLAADVPKGRTLKIIIKGGIWYYRVMPNGPVNWTISRYENEQQTFEASESGKSCDLSIQFGPGFHTIEYYENNIEVPTRIKVIPDSIVSDSSKITYPRDSEYGMNILHDDIKNNHPNLSMAANLPESTSLKIILKGESWFYNMSKVKNWAISEKIDGQQSFETIESGKNCDMWIGFVPGCHTIEFYENGSLEPTKIKAFPDSVGCGTR